MDPFSALGLAGNIVQFVDFSSKLISAGVEIYKSTDGISQRNMELIEVFEDLNSITEALNEGSTNKNKRGYSKDEIALMDIALKCKVLADKLLETLRSLAVKRPGKKWQTVRQALRSMWKEKDIQDMQTRLNDLRSQLTLRLVAILSDQRSTVNTSLQNLTYSHQRMEINSTGSLDTLRNELQIMAGNLKQQKTGFSSLSDQITMVVTEGDTAARQSTILESLSFKTMGARQSKIVDAHERTFEWILRDKSGSSMQDLRFGDWLHSGTGIYWITGKAGSGKSTLMKYIADHEKVKKMLKEWAGSKSLVTGSYYFWSSGNEMQKSLQGLLQSLLYNVLRQCPAIMPEVIKSRWETSISQMVGPWTIPELLSAFQKLTTQQSLPAKFCFFLDGLDEYDGDPVQIIELVQTFSASLDIKVCLSSRPWTEIKTALNLAEDRRLTLQHFTRLDIQLYIRDLFQSDRRFQEALAEDKNYDSLALEILEKAEGVFLWVFLVVRRLLDGLTHADTIKKLRQRLDAMPPDLESYFMHMLDSIEPIYHHQTARIFQMVLAAGGSLPLLTFAFLETEEEDQNYAINASIYPLEENQLQQKFEVTRKRVLARCRDLINISTTMIGDNALPNLLQGRLSEARQNDPRFHVDFLHRTVRDFFLQKSKQDLLAGWIDIPFEPHLSLCCAFLAQMKMLPWETRNSSARPPPVHDLIEDFLYHARAIERDESTKLTEFALVNEVDKVALARRDEKFTPTSLDETSNTKKLISTPLGLRPHSDYKSGWIATLAIQAGLKNYVAHLLEQQPELIAKIHGRPPLFCALLSPASFNDGPLMELNPEMIQLLLLRSANPNQAYLDDSTWAHFLRSVYNQRDFATKKVIATWAEVFKLLLEHGASPDVMVEIGRKAGAPTFSGRVVTHPVQISVYEILDKCCPVQSAHLKSVAERKQGSGILRWLGWN